MRFTALIASILGSAAVLVTAAPTPVDSGAIVARACKTATATIARVDQAQPVASYLPGFIISQEANRNNRRDVFAEFNTPPNSYGCQLEVYFPAGFPIWNSGSDSERRVDVFSVPAPLSRSPVGVDISWNYSPAPGALVGSVTFKSDPTKETKVVINSFQCDRAMAYRFRIASEVTAASSVYFEQGYNGAGVRMVYNC